jgi:DNA polymerase sigma
MASSAENIPPRRKIVRKKKTRAQMIREANRMTGMTKATFAEPLLKDMDRFTQHEFLKIMRSHVVAFEQGKGTPLGGQSSDSQACLQWFLGLPLAEKISSLCSPPGSLAVHEFQELCGEIQRKGGFGKVSVGWDNMRKCYTTHLIEKRPTEFWYLPQEATVRDKCYVSGLSRGSVFTQSLPCSSFMGALETAEKRCAMALVAVLGGYGRNTKGAPRSLSFLPYWIGNHKHFFHDLGLITCGKFMSKLPDQAMINRSTDSHAFLKADPWQPQVRCAYPSWYDSGNRHTMAEELACVVELSIWRAWRLHVCSTTQPLFLKKLRLESIVTQQKAMARNIRDTLDMTMLWRHKLKPGDRAKVIRDAKLSNVFGKGVEQFYRSGLKRRPPPNATKPFLVLVEALPTVFQAPSNIPTMLYLPAVKVGTIHEKIATRLAQSLADFASVWRGEQLLLDDARLGLKNGGRGGAAAEKAPDTAGKNKKKKQKKKKKKERQRREKARKEREEAVSFVHRLLFSIAASAEKVVKKKRKASAKVEPGAGKPHFHKVSISEHGSPTTQLAAGRKALRKGISVEEQFQPHTNRGGMEKRRNSFDGRSGPLGMLLGASRSKLSPKKIEFGTQTESSEDFAAAQFLSKDESQALIERINNLEQRIETLYLEKRDLQAEREVYRYELSSYKEAMSALRASGCVPPTAALMTSSTTPMSASPLRDSVDSATAALEFHLTKEIEAFVRCVRNDSEERLAARMATLKRCTAAVRRLWPRAQVKLYGSFVTGFQLPRSDIDVVICLPKVQREVVGEAGGTLEGRNAIKETWQNELSRCLKECRWVFSETVKSHGKVLPIITLATRPLGGHGLHGKSYSVRLDISFESDNHFGLATNKLMQSLARDLPSLTPLVLIMKEFLSQQGFLTSFTGGLSSYGLALIISRFLQSTLDSSGNGHTHQSLGGLLLAFLDHLGNRFDPATTGISVHNRCYLDRLNRPQSARGQMDGSPLVPRPYQPYSSDDGRAISESGGAQKHIRMYGFDPHKFDPLHIEDPLNGTNNVGRNCFRVNYILRACSNGLAKILREGKLVAGVNTPEYFSILGTLMTIPPSFKLEEAAEDQKPLFLSADHLAEHNRR